MFKQIAKYTFFTFIWKRYRATILATLLVLFYFWLVGRVHSDFIAYAELRGESANLGVSFLIKWLLFILGFIIYLVYIFLWSIRTPSKIKTPRSATRDTSVSEVVAAKNDPFTQLRQKQELRSRSDLVIEKYPKKEP